MNKPQLIHYTVDGHLRCFHFMANMNKATMNILLLEASTPFSWIYTWEKIHPGEDTPAHGVYV